MKYDFTSIISRANTGSEKWEQMKGWNPNISEDTVPFSVADMEFKNPPEIIEGLKNYLDSVILGYTGPTENYYKAVCSWMKERHAWNIKPEWIVGSAGVVSAFFSAIKALTKPGDGIVVMSPVYYPFYMAIEKNDRKVVKSQLTNNGKTYEIDFEDLEKKTQDPSNKILLFCSPHNPVGRVWTTEELERVGEICLRNKVLIISDEIHFDIIMPGYKHTVFASLSEELANNMIVCTAPSKTFNLAGLQTSNIIIPNEKIRDAYRKEVESNGFFSLNIFGYKACEIAYTQCENWLEELIEIVHHNHLELKKYIEENIPAIKVFELQGTYLQWMDFNKLGLDKDELEKLMHESELFFDEGYIFGEEGIGFERMNLACPTSVLMKALERLKNAIDKMIM
ncbi:pyridoxal phosphate-dependent aminotransferase [Clostridium swellfunianum]|uniref:MalY/PatB family protein n=1 Tax=Clostridium swellfunianum TaxID=1367462 RepID=UPI00202DC660|nr:MalY/PatB family protein [Clostridium swellfunianum]MCM0647493.1 pyridoxal phosphate-dependent aminotransferase [Clostridium swellfunianum]